MVKVAIGQDSHKFDFSNSNKKLILGGLIFEGCPPLKGNSDADVILHSITNAVSGITCVNILGTVADEMCKNGVIDSKEYLKKALEYLINYKINHLSISIECKVPNISSRIEELRENIASILNIKKQSIGITATTGEGLTEFGKGEGIQVLTILTVEEV